ncbi:hypothetical protein AB4Y42_41975 [Paraburkholderia sp. EG286B]|uniref:hypothetical protein n=1 Tax=Paraburkholderia sp. EG286B TaxID=3237011 RepID=UPI0034D2F2B5
MNTSNNKQVPGIEGFRVLTAREVVRRKGCEAPKKAPTHRFLIDVASVVALLTLVLCEFMFPLADKEFADQPSTLVVELAVLGGRAQDAMDKFDASVAEFKRASYGQQRSIGDIGIDLDRILAHEVGYLSYYLPAGMVLVDELGRLKLLDSRTAEWEKSVEGKQLIAAIEQIKILQPKLDQCFQGAQAEQHKIDASLLEGPDEKTRVDLSVSTITALGDLLKSKNGRWLACRNDLVDFDRQLVKVTGNYSFVVEQLEKRATFEKNVRLVLKGLATLILAICGATYRNRWLKAATASLSGR